MLRLSIVPAMLIVILSGCQPSATLTSRTTDSLPDPSGSSEDHLGYFVSWELDGGRRSYGVLTYGRKVKLEVAANQDDMVADGKILTPPYDKDGVLWALTPDGKFHRLDLDRREVGEIVERIRAEGFLASPLWRERLKPRLEAHRWPPK